MALVELCYFSEVDSDLGSEEVGRILNSAQKNNPPRGLTGVLLFNRRFFAQILEGSPEAVNETFRRIQSDARHSNVSLVSFQSIDRRRFSEWAMGYVPESSVTTDVLLKYSGSSQFSPADMSATALSGMIQELSDRVAVSS